MKRINYIMLVISTLLLSSASGYSSQRYFHIRMNTNKGEIILLLYNQTPLHRDNFVKLSKEGYFNGVLFHRVINDFMIQSGDPDDPFFFHFSYSFECNKRSNRRCISRIRDSALD